MVRRAVVLPGRMYGPHAPLLFYAGEALQARGAAVEVVDWRPPAAWDPPNEPTSTERHAWVLGEAGPVLDRQAGKPLLVGKSLGSFGAALAASRELPAIWFTPLLLDELVVEGLRASAAPFLLIGGTADVHAWDGGLARSLTPYVCEIPDADHSLMVPAGLVASAAVLGEVTAAVESFLDEVIWPGD
jgi:hypothetical protein